MREQAAEIADWNRELEDRVAAQVERARAARPAAPLPVRRSWPTSWSTTRACSASHRREIVVVFCDLRGFTSFAEASEPEEVMGVLGEYHQALGS